MNQPEKYLKKGRVNVQALDNLRLKNELQKRLDKVNRALVAASKRDRSAVTKYRNQLIKFAKRKIAEWTKYPNAFREEIYGPGENDYGRLCKIGAPEPPNLEVRTFTRAKARIEEKIAHLNMLSPKSHGAQMSAPVGFALKERGTCLET